ncbi:Protein CBG02248 [Caenorhabditis briggsae]|uniref:Ceramide transfer protein n=1 Tax=Caenorhabditis briggsae TaxID=6238 RepID=A8WS67_CAEBR|nr:Protein CBG02248 [Caenorhabditis briggsae]CAP23325.2 Protein CBG02248 [Caenorhabditis briggsae]
MENEVVLPTNGVLKKWTNYVNGWQERYFEITEGNLVYFKSKAEKTHGCRGSIFLKNAIIAVRKAHEFDENEFSISMGENVVWYLKAENSQSKLLWMRSVVRVTIQNDSDYSSTSTKSHSRNPSVSSALASIHQKTDDANEVTKLFSTKLSELEAYRTMCKDQMMSIERLLEQGGASCIVPQATILSVKATHLALIVNINHIVDLVKTSKVVIPENSTSSPATSSPATSSVSTTPPPVREALCATRSVSSSVLRLESTEQEYMSDDNSTMTTSTILARPDIDVTSDCDEFFDADEFDVDSKNGDATLSKNRIEASSEDEENGNIVIEKEEENKKPNFRVDGDPVTGHYDDLLVDQEHSLFSTIDKLAVEQLKYALAGVEDNVWSLFAEDGPMRMYTRQVEDEGGLPVDPLKATHSVDGVTALEFMHYFYDARYKMQWDHTLEAMSVVEHISPDSVVLHQKHKTIWPAAPRESLFVSHIRRVDEHKRDGAHDLYIVCNRDVQRADVPLGSSSAVRVGLTVSMICETIIKDPHIERKLTRDDVQCNIIYVSQVHPGGWVPVSALRHVYKKEYPKFLRTFTEFVKKNVKGKPLSI